MQCLVMPHLLKSSNCGMNLLWIFLCCTPTLPSGKVMRYGPWQITRYPSTIPYYIDLLSCICPHVHQLSFDSIRTGAHILYTRHLIGRAEARRAGGGEQYVLLISRWCAVCSWDLMHSQGGGSGGRGFEDSKTSYFQECDGVRRKGGCVSSNTYVSCQSYRCNTSIAMNSSGCHGHLVTKLPSR